MTIGTVQHWKEERGFGWFRLPSGKLVFCHITEWIEDGIPEVGRTVEFDIVPGKNNPKPQAAAARYYKNPGADALKAGV